MNGMMVIINTIGLIGTIAGSYLYYFKEVSARVALLLSCGFFTLAIVDFAIQQVGVVSILIGCLNLYWTKQYYDEYKQLKN